MGDLLHFVIITSRYAIIAVLVMCLFVVGLMAADIYIIHLENPRFIISDTIPFVVLIGILIGLFFLVKRKERQIEERRGFNKTDDKITE